MPYYIKVIPEHLNNLKLNFTYENSVDAQIFPKMLLYSLLNLEIFSK